MGRHNAGHPVQCDPSLRQWHDRVNSWRLFIHVLGTRFYWPVETPYFTPPYAAIPDGTDVIITHNPAAAHVDGGAGCAYLLQQIERVQPRAVICGHIHEAHGVCQGTSTSLANTTFVNASNAGGPSTKQARSLKLGWPPIVLDV